MNARAIASICTAALMLHCASSAVVAQVTRMQITGKTPRVLDTDGSVVACSTDYHTFHLTSTGVSTWIGNIGQRTAAYGISGDGLVIVGSSGPYGFYWSQATGILNLGHLSPGVPPDYTTTAYAASDNGSVVAGISNFMPFRWTLATGITPLPYPTTEAGGWARCMNASGSVIGGHTFSNTQNKACRWVNGVHEPIVELDPIYRSSAVDMSADGRTIVGYTVPTHTIFDDTYMPIRWVEGEGLEYLPLPPQCDFAIANSTTGDGRVVFGSGALHNASGSPYYSVQFVWTPVLGTVLLVEQLSRMGVDLQGLSIYWAKISKDGTSMIFGTTPQAETTQYFLLRGLPPFDCGQADRGHSGGLSGGDGRLDNNDFIAFIDLFFGADSRADMGKAGGLSGSDGQFDNNDFIAFIEHFFTGCAG